MYNYAERYAERKDISLHVDPKFNSASLTAKYIVENNAEIIEIEIGGINLDSLLPLYRTPMLNHEISMASVDGSYYISDVPNEIGVSYIKSEVIKRKTKEMTLEEIEAALGYSVKIVNKKEVNND